MLNEPSAREEWSHVPKEETGRHPWPLLVQNAADGWGAKIARAQWEIERMVKKWKTTVRNEKKTCVYCHYSYIFIADIFVTFFMAIAPMCQLSFFVFFLWFCLNLPVCTHFFPSFFSGHIYICTRMYTTIRTWIFVYRCQAPGIWYRCQGHDKKRSSSFFLFFCFLFTFACIVYSSFRVDPMARYITLSPPLDATEARLYRLLLPW